MFLNSLLIVFLSGFVGGIYPTVKMSFGQELNESELKVLDGAWADDDHTLYLLEYLPERKRVSVAIVERESTPPRFRAENFLMDFRKSGNYVFAFVPLNDSGESLIFLVDLDSEKQIIFTPMSATPLLKLSESGRFQMDVKRSEQAITQMRVSAGEDLISVAIENDVFGELFPKSQERRLSHLMEWRNKKRD